MFEPATRFTIRGGDTAAKAFEDEVILINLATGLYYSLDGPGALVWSLVEGGHSFETIIDQLCEQLDVSNETATADVGALLSHLLSEDLVALSSGASVASAPLPEPPSGKATYRAPTLNVYDDMAALMALDPPMPGFMDSTSNDKDA